MHIHILGICGTFMAGIAVLAKQQGHTVTGSDAAAYPPMSTQLQSQGIDIFPNYSAAPLEQCQPEWVVIGNALSRGNPAVEYVLNNQLRYISGPQWLAEHILADRSVIAVAGTHGKTTTTSLVTWILEEAGFSPGFLIGGVPENFGVSACLGKSPFFVVEADEYDTAFFDKRSKFLHYHPRFLILNNLEFDHADIFPDLAAIQRQFHHLIRTVPSQGVIIQNQEQTSLAEVIKQGCWTPRETFGEHGDWQAKTLTSDNSQFEVWYQGQRQGEVKWNLLGRHNIDNALAALACTHHAGVPIATACEALGRFKNVKRRLELRGVVKGVSIYDDFAHHPTAIAVTLEALRRRVGSQPIITVLEPRSNTMRMGVHRDTLASSLTEANTVILYQPDNLGWSLAPVAAALPNAHLFKTVEEIIQYLVSTTQAGDQVLIMSNGDFQGIHQRLLAAL